MKEEERYTIDKMAWYVNNSLAHIFSDGIAWVKLYDWQYEGPTAIYWYNNGEGCFYLLRFGYFIEDRRLGKSIFLDDDECDYKLALFSRMRHSHQKCLKNKQEIQDKTKYHNLCEVPNPFVLYGEDITE